MDQDISYSLAMARHSCPVLHPLFDIESWRVHYLRMKETELRYRDCLEKAVKDLEDKITQMAASDSLSPDELRLYHAMKFKTEFYSERIGQHQYEANAYAKLSRKLKKFEAKENDNLESIYRSYQKEKEKMERQSEKVESRRVAYHKQMFRIEKTRIKSQLATKLETVVRMETRAKTLNEKAIELRTKYQDSVGVWEEAFQAVQKLSVKYEEEFRKRLTARANKVVQSLREAEDEVNGNTVVKAEYRDLSKINIRGAVQRFLKQNRESLKPAVFEEYLYDQDADAMYQVAKAEIEDEEIEHRDKDDAISDDEFRQDLAFNRRLKTIRKEQTFLVSEDYQKQEVNELNLRLGEKVTQLLPPNDEGFAFGEVTRKTGALHQTKKGYYPVSHVVLVDKISEDDFIDDKETAKQRYQRAKSAVKTIAKEEREKKLRLEKELQEPAEEKKRSKFNAITKVFRGKKGKKVVAAMEPETHLEYLSGAEDFFRELEAGKEDKALDARSLLSEDAEFCPIPRPKMAFTARGDDLSSESMSIQDLDDYLHA